MARYDVDEVDRDIIELLQENGRYTAVELAEAVGVSDNTIHNRMERLAEEGVITGYGADVDYERIGLSLYFLFVCTARISKRTAVAEKLLDLPSVTEVTELMTGERNLLVKTFGARDEDITAVAERIDRLELEINDEHLIREERGSAVDGDEMARMLANAEE